MTYHPTHHAMICFPSICCYSVDFSSLKDISTGLVDDVEALGAVQNLRGVRVCSLVLDDPPRGSKIVFAPESAPFFSDKIGRFATVTSKFTIMSFPFAAGNLSLLRVPKRRRRSSDTVSKFNLFSSHHSNIRCTCVSGKSEQQNQNHQSGGRQHELWGRMELRMCKSLIVSLVSVVPKMKICTSLVCSPKPVNELSLRTKLFPAPQHLIKTFIAHWFLDLTLCVCPCSVLFLDSSLLCLSPSLGRSLSLAPTHGCLFGEGLFQTFLCCRTYCCSNQQCASLSQFQ